MQRKKFISVNWTCYASLLLLEFTGLVECPFVGVSSCSVASVVPSGRTNLASCENGSFEYLIRAPRAPLHWSFALWSCQSLARGRARSVSRLSHPRHHFGSVDWVG